MNRWLRETDAVVFVFAVLVLAGAVTPPVAVRPAGATAFDHAEGKSFTGGENIGAVRSSVGAGRGGAQQASNAADEKKKAEEAANKSRSMKPHLDSGNNAMHEAQAIREQIATATGSEKTALTAKMNADYQTAITEYEEALKIELAEGSDDSTAIGLIGQMRNGLISREKQAEFEGKDKNVPVILGNLGLAYSGAGNYQGAIPLLRESAASKPTAATYMQLGTDLAAVGKVSEGTATCDKIPAAEPTATALQATCYKNIAILLTNEGKLADAVAPLQRASQLNPNDALAWKMLGDALTNSITTKQENGKIVYLIPAGTIEAYQKYLQLAPNGPYARQVKTALDGFAQLPKSN